MASEVAAIATIPSVAPTAVLPRLEARPFLASVVATIPAVEASHAGAVRVVVKIAKDVVLDGPGPTVPRRPLEAVARARLLVVGANVTTGRRRPTRSVPGRSAGAATGLVVGLVLATTSPTTRPRRTRVPVQAAEARSARLGLAKPMAGQEVAVVPPKTAPLVATTILSTALARVPTGVHVAPRLAKVAVAATRRVELEAAKDVVPVAIGPILGQNHAVAQADERVGASRLARPTELRHS